MMDKDRQRQPNDGREDAIKLERSRYSTKLIMEALQHIPWALTNYQLNRKHFSIPLAPAWDQLHVVAGYLWTAMEIFSDPKPIASQFSEQFLLHMTKTSFST